MSLRTRKDLEEQLLNRGQESHDTLDDTGRFGNYFKRGIEGFQQWKCGEGEHVIDILLWEIGENYPTKSYPNLKPGDAAYVLDLWVHYNVGSTEDSYACPARNYDKHCPICDHVNDLRKMEEPDDDLIKTLIPKRRSVYNIICYDNDAEESKGVQVFEVAHFFMEKHLAERAKKPKGGGYILFAHPTEGKQIYWKRKGTGKTSTEYLNHQFLDREYEISIELEEKALSLDECIHIPPFEELYEKYWGKEYNPAQPKAEIEPEPEEEQPAARRRTRKPPVQQEEAKQEEEQPAARRRTRKPPVQQKEEKKDTKCPAKGVFGVDISNFDLCNTCEIWDDCAAENDRIEKEQKSNKNTTRRRT